MKLRVPIWTWVIWLWLLIVIVPAVLVAELVKAEPLAARQYRSTLTREVHTIWGLDAPVAVFAGQLEQESGWNPNVCSAVACGLAQFTGPTAKEVSRQLGVSADVFNPAWALRAVVAYDRNLYRATEAIDDCNHWAFTLSAYNGGLGNVRRDQRLCSARGSDCNPNLWFGGTAAYSNRSAGAYAENRAYILRILGTRQFTYATWGATVPCPRS